MTQFIRTNNNKKCSRISFDAQTVDIEKWKLEHLEVGEYLIEVEEIDIPKEPIEMWQWDKETQAIIIDESKRLPDPVKALNSLQEFTASEIIEMGLDYLLLMNAIVISHKPLVNQLLVKIEGASYLASEKVRIILEESNFIVISGETLPF